MAAFMWLVTAQLHMMRDRAHSTAPSFIAYACSQGLMCGQVSMSYVDMGLHLLLGCLHIQFVQACHIYPLPSSTLAWLLPTSSVQAAGDCTLHSAASCF